MFQDRRRFPRYPVLLKVVVLVDRDRHDAVCTDIGPASAFFTSRVEVKPAQPIAVEMRAAGLGSPVVVLHGSVVRVSPAGGAWPAGFAVGWTTARCELGPEPLIKVLTSVLRLPDVRLQDIPVDRAAELDIARFLAAAAAAKRPASGIAPASTPSTTAVRRVVGSWSQAPNPSTGRNPVIGIAPGAGRTTVEDAPVAQQRHAGSAQVGSTVGSPAVGSPTLGSPTLGSPTARGSSGIQPARPLGMASGGHPVSPTVPLGSAVHASTAVAAPSAHASPGHVPLQAKPPVQPPAPPSGGTAGAPQLGWRGPTLGRSPSDPFGFDENNLDRTPVETQAPDLMIATPPPLERSRVFEAKDEVSVAVGRREMSSLSGEEGPSQSWPVYALAPGERRPLTRSGVGTNPAQDILSGIRAPASSHDRPTRRTGETPATGQQRPSVGIPASTVGFDKADKTEADARLVPHRDWSVDLRNSGGRPASSVDSIRPLSGVHRPTAPPGAPTAGKPGTPRPVSNVHAPARDPRMMRHFDVPVTFVRNNHLIPGRIVSIADKAVAIVTDGTPPELDEPLTVNLPVEIKGAYRTLYLSGRLLQIATDTEQGKRFVMHIERVEEGKHKGAFKDLLASLPE